jgi:predicted secreted Zn-dependent protease
MKPLIPILINFLFLSINIYSEEIIQNCEPEFYEIQGTKPSEWIKEMKSKTPSQEGYFGLFKYNWTYDCRNLKIHCVVHLPKLVQNLDNYPEAKEKWFNFYNALVIHEQGHVDIFRKEFDAIEIKLSSTNQCKDAKKLLQSSTAKVNKMNKKFDEDTEHGILQGAVLEANSFQSIAYSQNNNSYGFSFGQISKEVAEKIAVENCPDEDCKIVMWSKNSCASLAVGLNNGYGVAWDSEKSISEKKALNNCKNFTKNCKILISTCPEN